MDTPRPTIAHPTIAQLQGTSLVQLVQAEIERMILGGELAPGAKLTEAPLVERLGVSRGPIREAFRMLDQAGLVRTEKNRGVFVRELPIEEVLEIFEVRAMLEQGIGRKLAQTVVPAQARALRALVVTMEAAAKAADADAFHRSNLQFHDTLLALAGNAKLAATYRALTKELTLHRRHNLTPESMAVYAREHRQIVKAIAAGDAEAAGQAMHDHVMNSRERTLRKHRLGEVQAA
jgi:phosphonate utilization transcriptional regulator